MQNRFTRTLPLLASLSLSTLAAACSGSGDGGVPEAPKPTATETTPTEPGTGTSGGTSTTPPLRTGVGPEVLEALTKGGVDVATLPADLEDLTGDKQKLSAVMKSFTIALGTTCDGCHVKSGAKIDYSAPSPKKNVAKKMWSTFVRGLQQADGSALYCDSCHQGKMKFLDRANKEALSTWMAANFVTKLARRDGAEHGCATCHGSPFDGNVIEAWEK